MATTTTNVRPSEIRNLKARTPYCAWYDGSSWDNTHSHPTQRDPITSSPPPQASISQPQTWPTQAAHGSKHALDIADFSLWDSEKSDYRTPSKEQVDWIFQTYSAKSVEFLPPYFLVVTDTPALPQHGGKITLTIGGAPVVFTSPVAAQDGFIVGKPLANAMHLVDIRSQDPLASVCHAQKWQPPTHEQAKMVLSVLETGCNVHAMNFLYPDLIVELAQDGKDYKPGSLPSRIGGWSLSYHQNKGNDSFWGSNMPKSRLRELDASTNTKGDTINYLQTGSKVLGPGVRVEGRNMATTSGVRVKNQSKVRVTFADHGFHNCTRIFHPDGNIGDHVAEIIERFPEHDWALGALLPSAPYSNSQVFECPAPMRLLKGGEIKLREWYECDGMSTGKVALRFEGHRYVSGNQPNDRITASRWTPASVFFGLAPTGGAQDIKDGICGAPIIGHDGGVSGFFQYMEDRGYCFSPQLDVLIDNGWELY